ncbi:MAG: RNase H family protein [Candidatus Methanomethylicaceae archaeon]
MFRFRIFTDGWCKGNGTESAQAGGSFVIVGARSTKHFQFALDGIQTNNRAELESVARALETLIELLGDRYPGQFEVEIRTDSAIAANVLTWKIREPHLIEIRDRIAKAAKRFHNVIFTQSQGTRSSVPWDTNRTERR